MKSIYFVLFISLLFACKPENPVVTKPVKTTKVKQQKKATPAKKKNFDVAYWDFMKKQVPLSQSEITSLKAIDKKYSPKVNALKKQKKWDGAKNAKNRQPIVKQKTKEYKQILKSKLDKFQTKRQEFLKNWNKKK